MRRRSLALENKGEREDMPIARTNATAAGNVIARVSCGVPTQAYGLAPEASALNDSANLSVEDLRHNCFVIRILLRRNTSSHASSRRP